MANPHVNSQVWEKRTYKRIENAIRECSATLIKECTGKYFEGYQAHLSEFSSEFLNERPLCPLCLREEIKQMRSALV